MPTLVKEAGLEQSSSSVLERNRENYSRVCQRLNRYLSREFLAKSPGQQPPIWRLFYLAREAIRLSARINGATLAPNTAAVGLIVSLEAYVSYGVDEDKRRRALRIVIDICKFLCREVREESA